MKTSPGQPRLLQGNEALVAGALAAGCLFFDGYPITPATEISEVMAQRLPGVGAPLSRRRTRLPLWVR